MADDVARAVGARGANGYTIAGKECRPRALNIKELAEVERHCLKQYKRQYLETFSENLDLLNCNVEDRSVLLQKKIDECARWDVTDLPPKTVYDPSRVVINDKIKKWVKEEWSDSVPTKDLDDDQIRKLVTTALDMENLSEDEYEKMAGTKPKKRKTGYANWWTTGSFDGMITMIWACFEHEGITKQQIEDELASNPSILISISRDIEELSAPDLGNG